MTIFNRTPTRGMQQIAGTFYRETPNALLVDTMMHKTQSTETSLYRELQKYKELERQDMAYARLVAGTSTVSKNHQIWVLRNENSTHMTQHQLQYLQNAALTDLVRKRFMAANGSTVADMGQSVAEVVQSLSLQWEQFQLWGLHHVVEACECEVVLMLMQSGFLIRDPNIRAVAIRLRRCEDMCVPFALCVGAFICANQGLMAGATVTKVNGLRQEDHKLSLLRFMQDAITQNQDSLYECLARQDDTDYVNRLSYINIVSPTQNIPDVVMSDDSSGGVSVQVDAQNTGDVMKVERSLTKQLNALRNELMDQIDSGRSAVRDLTNQINTLKGQMQQVDDDSMRDQEQHSDTKHPMETFQEQLDQLKVQINTKYTELDGKLQQTTESFNQQIEQLKQTDSVLTRTLEINDREISELNTTIKLSQKIMDETNSLEQEIQQQKQIINQTQLELERINDQIQTMSLEITTLSRSTNASRNPPPPTTNPLAVQPPIITPAQVPDPVKQTKPTPTETKPIIPYDPNKLEEL